MRVQTLRRRLGAALLGSAVVLALLIVVATSALVEVRERQREVVEVYFSAVTETDAAYIAMVDAETALRGYLLTGDPSALEPMEALPSADRLLDDPHGYVAEIAESDPAVGTTRGAAAEAAATWFTEFAEPTLVTARERGPGAVTVAEVERGKALFDDFRVAVTAHIGLLLDGREDAAAGLASATYQLLAAFLAVVAGAVVAGALLWIFLRRWVTEPLGRLAADARTVAEGDVDHVLETTGPGEVGDVGRDVERMRGQLAGLLAQADAARDELTASHARLVEQAEDLRRSNRDLEQFAYVASHDLQEPLRKVASFTQLLARRYEGQLDERADQYIGFAVDGAKRMQRLINDLLEFSRVGRSDDQHVDVDLDVLVAAAVGDLAGQIAAVGGEVTWSDLPVVHGEPLLLTQLVTNLVSNALKFRAPDRSPVVQLSARRSGSRWELACTDNGIGIDEQHADRVFVIFQRLHSKESYEGTGIGLALCKKIVEHHGGQIWVDTSGHHGTTVRWTLPPGTVEVPGSTDAAPGDGDRPSATPDE